MAERPIAEAIHARLAHFAPAETVDIRFEYTVVPTGADHRVHLPAEDGRKVYESPLGDVRYHPDANRLTIACDDRVLVDCDPAGVVRVSLRESERSSLWLLSRPLFTLPLMEMLKRRGLYAVHAAAVSEGGRALLLAGATGSGKSTLAVALVRAGFGFMGDDLAFLGQAERLRIHAFPDEVDVTDESARFFPELAALLERPLEQGWPKRRFSAPDVYGAVVIEEAAPGLLVLSRVSAAEASALEPIGEEDALLELAPNVLLTEPAAAQAHLDALGALVRASRCYRLEVGRDLAELAASLRELLSAGA